MDEPFCLLTGSTPGECGKCTTNAECKGHSGDICDTTSGLCSATCATDSDCLTSQWCNAAPGGRGMCEAKLVNGKPLPSTPSSVATCSAAVGKRVCVSSVCDPKTGACGFAVGDGSCTSNAECVDGMCDETTHTCGEMDAGAKCHKDTDCGKEHFCASDGTCTPTLPTGGTCDRPTQCQSNDCTAEVCSIVVSSGGGLSCSVRQVGGAGDAGDVGLFGLALALAGAGVRRRRASAPRA
jgi:MYXO-CTERM domain-containing protein